MIEGHFDPCRPWQGSWGTAFDAGPSMAPADQQGRDKGQPALWSAEAMHGAAGLLQ
jgi:hypothetical protein